MNREDLLREFFEKEAQHGFVTRLRDFLHRDFAHETVKDFRVFLFKRYKQMGKAPDFDLMELVPEIIKEVGAVQTQCIKLYTKFLHDEAVDNIKGRANGKGKEGAEVSEGNEGEGTQVHQEDGEERVQIGQ